VQGVGAHVEEDPEQAGGGDVAQRRRYLSTMLENFFFVVSEQNKLPRLSVSRFSKPVCYFPVNARGRSHKNLLTLFCKLDLFHKNVINIAYVYKRIYLTKSVSRFTLK
jgi:hypothetical protein